MFPNKKTLLSNYLSNLKVEMHTATYGRCPSNWKGKGHIYNYSKFYYIVDGEGWLKIGNTEFLPRPGQLFLIPEGVMYSYSTVNTNTFLKYWCHFSVKVGEINLFKLIDIKLLVDVTNRSYVDRIFSEMTAFYNTDEIHSMMMAKARLLELLYYFIFSIGEQSIDINISSNIKKLNSVIEYIDKSFRREITVDDLAKVACIHPNYFIKFFKDQIGVPPMHYINRKRIESAKEFLSTTGHPVGAIAECCGFNDPFYFSKLFKKNVGLTPTEYRNSVQGD